MLDDVLERLGGVVVEIGRGAPDSPQRRDFERVQAIERCRRQLHEIVIGAAGNQGTTGIRTGDLDIAIRYAIEVSSRIQIVRLIVEDKSHDGICRDVESRNEDILKTRTRRNRHRQERVGLIHQRPAVARGACERHRRP